MLIVAGRLLLNPADRDAHVAASAGAVRLAREAHGCLDFAVSADPVDPARVNVLERWAREADLRVFREAGTDDDASVDVDKIVAFEIEEYLVADAP